jgi:TPR repeat protein
LVEESPGEGVFHWLLGRSRGTLEEAQADFRRAAHQGFAEALYELSLWSAGVGNFPEALRQIQEALGMEPDDTYFRAQEEDLLVATQQYGQLIPRYRQRLDEDPLDHAAALQLAGLYEVTGQLDEADRVAERFLQAVALDGALTPEATQPYRERFAASRARWAGDAERFLRVTAAGAAEDRVDRLVLEGSYDEAGAAVERSSTDPFLHLLIYALALEDGGGQALAEVQLSQAIKLLQELSERGRRIAAWFHRDARAPSVAETLEAGIPNEHRRVLLFALAQRHPAAAEAYLPLAGKLNYHRLFPYLALKRALAENEE